MALNIKSDEADRLARQLAKATGEAITEAITIALRQRLERETHPRQLEDIAPTRIALREIRHRARDIAIKTDASDNELLGYDENGMWS
ncbi:MAG: type II toxin-antitoxin system VapB family antitoxin [Myxococcota bacterium]